MVGRLVTSTTIEQELARAWKKDSGRILATLIASLRDFDLAEDALQEACTQAIDAWAHKRRSQ